MDVIGLNRQLDHRPVVLRRDLANDLLQASAYGDDEHRAPPCGTPNDVVHHPMEGVSLRCIVHVDSVLVFYSSTRLAKRKGHSCKEQEDTTPVCGVLAGALPVS
jgi:hypothetical protein